MDASGETPKLNLDTFQLNQTRTRRSAADRAIDDRIGETYVWALVPSQTDPKEPMTWEEVRVTGSDALAKRTFKKLQNEQMLVTKLAASILRSWLDKIPLWDGSHIELRRLADYFAQYVYLTRLKDEEVLLGAAMDGVASTLWVTEGVAFADSYDESAGRYLGLKGGQLVGLTADLSGLVVHPDIALVQFDEENKPKPGPGPGPEPPPDPMPGPGPWPGPTPPPLPPVPPRLRRFHANATLEPLKAATQMQTLQKEVLQHLQAVVGSKVEIRIEVQATAEEGYADEVRRIVSENCAVLKVAGAFEEE